MTLFKFQEEGLARTKGQNRVAYYWEMGTGKTFVGSEKMMQLNSTVNLIVCQKSKVSDWLDHLTDNYGIEPYDLTRDKRLKEFMISAETSPNHIFGVINYDLLHRRPELSSLEGFTLVLDESSLIQNETTKRSRFIMKKLNADNIVLLSGTPCSGKYEKLWSQLHLLGWQISKQLFWNQFINYRVDTSQGFPLITVLGYKNVERLKEKMREYGCDFLKTDEVFDLPDQIETVLNVPVSKEYRTFRKDRVITIGDRVYKGDTTLTKMLYERMLCGQFSQEKLNALEDLLESTEDRVIIFYNFSDELHLIEDICHRLDKPVSIVNGRSRDLSCYNEYTNSVTLIQYQAGAMGLNLQKCNKIVYFTPPLSSELYEQSKKRIHRIGQKSNCFYWKLVCKGSIEERIYRVLAMRKDYTEALFEKGE